MGKSVSNEQGKKRAGNPNPVQHRIPDERFVAARILYETTPGATFKQVAEETGISVRSLEERSKRDGGWTKRALLPPTGMNEAAQAVADSYTGRLAEYGDEISADQKQVAVQETAVETAVDLRAQLIDRHRREWAAPRRLVYEAIQKRDFELAKLAKISTESLRNIQDGERKAWGIDKGEGDEKKVTLVIERGDA